MRLKHIFTLLVSAICALGCVDSDYFGLYNDANFTSFDIEGQTSNKIEPMVDWRDEGIVTIAIPVNLDITNLKIVKAGVSPLARVSPDPYSVTDFSKDVYFTIQAENGAVTKSWKVQVSYAEADTQIPFSDFNEWVVARKNNDGGEIYYTDPNSQVKVYGYFPGRAGALSPWQTAAESNAFVGGQINYITTTPKPSPSAAQYAHVETYRKTSGTPALAKAQIITGTLFTGQFLFNTSYAPLIGSNEPRKMVSIGTPFFFKPTAINFKMRYKPGAVMRDGEGNEIMPTDAAGRLSKDSCDIYAILHNRNSTADFIRIGAACFRTGTAVGDMNDDVNGFVDMTIPFVYGQPTPDQLAEKPYLNIHGARGEMLFYKFTSSGGGDPVITLPNEIYPADPNAVSVDNIAILFSSSAYGDSYWGAEGSTLDVKDFKLVY